jgi:NAD(P)-dependent dehydrogenase (short-subunit alcohol dehydrogenase family)
MSSKACSTRRLGKIGTPIPPVRNRWFQDLFRADAFSSRALRRQSPHSFTSQEPDMKIVVIGATGTLGKAVAAELKTRHEVIEVGATRGDYHVDVTNLPSVERLFHDLGKVDAVITTTGKLHFGPFHDMTADQFWIGLRDKLMGQVNVVLAAQHHVNDGGSFTLTSGIVAEEPIRDGVNATTVNLALEGFVRGAAIELPRGIRINLVSPTVLEESLAAYGSYFRGFEPVSAKRAALAYSRSVEGAQTGRVYRVGY